MPDITLMQAKQHLHLHMDISDDDERLHQKIDEALDAVAEYLDRPLTDPRCRDKTDAAKLSPSLRAAALLILGDLWENGEAQQMVTLNVNMTCQNLMNPFRRLGV